MKTLLITHRCGVASALGDVGRAGGDRPAFRAAVWSVRTHCERAGRRRAWAQWRIYKIQLRRTFINQILIHRSFKVHYKIDNRALYSG